MQRHTPNLAKVEPIVEDAVNKQVVARSATHYPNSQKLKHQSPKPWIANAAFVNCYDGPRESVGWHSVAGVDLT